MTDQAFAERDQLVELLAQVRALGSATTGTAGEGPASPAERLRDCVIGPLARLLDQAPDSDGRPDAAPEGEALAAVGGACQDGAAPVCCPVEMNAQWLPPRSGKDFSG